MKELKLTITADSPLAMGRRKPGGSVYETETFIPGTVIRGAVASQLLRLANPAEADLSGQGDDFAALFLSEQPAVFRNAYPTITTSPDQIAEALAGEINVLPATALSSKNNGGFKSQGKDGAFDTLIDRLCAETVGHAYDPVFKDGGRVDGIGGFYGFNGQQRLQTSVSSRLLTRVGINRRRATAEENVLFSVAVLNETTGKNHQPTTFRSSILVSETERPNLAADLSRFLTHQSFRFGGSASRGLGKVSLSVDKVQPAKTDVEHQVQQFNQALQTRWKKWNALYHPSKPDWQSKTFFVLDLQSDAVLRDRWRRTTVISPEMLCQFAEVQDTSLTLHAAYSTYDYVSGWNAAWGLMKDIELITQRGAVYLFSTDRFEDLWLEPLSDFSLTGIGDLTAEGFGQVQICNDFHTVFQEDPQ